MTCCSQGSSSIFVVMKCCDEIRVYARNRPSIQDHEGFENPLHVCVSFITM